MEDNIQALDDVHAIEKLIRSSSSNGEKIAEIMAECRYKISSLLSVDVSLKEYLMETKNSNEVYDSEQFPSKIKDISSDSLIIYVKKADLYKVYRPDGLNDYCQDSLTHYRKQEHGPVYEIVRDANPQKLMIVISDSIRDERLQHLKARVIEFIKKHKEYSELTNELTIYDNNNKTEFVFSRIRFGNLQEKEDFIENFADFMRTKGEDDIAESIDYKAPRIKSAPGARVYNLPELKMVLDNSSPSSNILDKLISTETETPVPVVKNITINIINSNVGNNIGNIKKVKVTNNVRKVVKKTLETFCKYICDTKPQWYEEDKFVSIETIVEAYRDYFNDYESHISVISKKLNGKLFSISTRSRAEGITKKKLHTFEILRENF